MLPLLLFALLQTAPAKSFTPLEAYNGTWTVKALHPFGKSPVDHLENRCHAGQAFYTCEQVVNGEPAALVIFTAGKEPGKFDVDNVFPNGHCSSNTDLIVAGDHWTYLSHATGEGGKTYRTENIFTGPNHIHFTQFESADNGKTWTETNSGEETRQP